MPSRLGWPGHAQAGLSSAAAPAKGKGAPLLQAATPESLADPTRHKPRSAARCAHSRFAVCPPGAQSLPDGSTIVGDFSASLLRGVDPTRSLVRSAFEGPVVACYDVQEAVFDHAFERLGCEGASVAHPVVCSEPLLAPPSSRARVAELLFETYGCPEVVFGADAAFAWAACAPRGHGGGSGAASGVQGSGLVLTAGHSSSLLLPVHAGVPLPSAAVRLEVGGLAVTGYLCDLLRAVAPEFGRALGAGAWTRAEELKHALCHVAGDYAAEAAAYAAGARASVGAGGAHNSSQRFAPGRPVRVQLPWTPRVVKAGAAAPTEEDLARREAHRKASVRTPLISFVIFTSHRAQHCSQHTPPSFTGRPLPRHPRRQARRQDGGEGFRGAAAGGGCAGCAWLR